MRGKSESQSENQEEIGVLQHSNRKSERSGVSNRYSGAEERGDRCHERDEELTLVQKEQMSSNYDSKPREYEDDEYDEEEYDHMEREDFEEEHNEDL